MPTSAAAEFSAFWAAVCRLTLWQRALSRWFSWFFDNIRRFAHALALCVAPLAQCLGRNIFCECKKLYKEPRRAGEKIILYYKMDLFSYPAYSKKLFFNWSCCFLNRQKERWIFMSFTTDFRGSKSLDLRHKRKYSQIPFQAQWIFCECKKETAQKRTLIKGVRSNENRF